MAAKTGQQEKGFLQGKAKRALDSGESKASIPRLFLVLLAVLAVAFIAAAALRQDRPEYFTEVYFSPTALQATQATLLQDYSLQFVIASHEQAATTYDYLIAFQGKELKGTQALAPGESKTITQSLQFLQAEDHAKITVTVQARDNESISVWHWVKVSP